MATRRPGVEPQDSEFSHGRGLMPDPKLGPEPSGFETLRAYYQLDSVDPETELFKPNDKQGFKLNTKTMRGNGARQDGKAIVNPYRSSGRTTA